MSFVTYPLTFLKHLLFTNKRESNKDDLRADIRASIYKSEFLVFRGNNKE